MVVRRTAACRWGTAPSHVPAAEPRAVQRRATVYSPSAICRLGPARQLRVRHLGYSPVEVSVDRASRADSDSNPLSQLSHIAVRLSAVEVRAYPECKNPGSSARRPSDSDVRGGVRPAPHQNAEQYRLLTETYPYRSYAVERTLLARACQRRREDRWDRHTDHSAPTGGPTNLAPWSSATAEREPRPS